VAEEEVDGHVLLVVQGKGQQGKKNGCPEDPFKQPSQLIH
jgi:hypothetical protein